MERVNTIIRYIGGKRRMAKKIESIIPENCSTLIEPFAGSAVVSINCTGFQKTVLNDADWFISSLLQIVSDRKKGCELLKILESASFSKTEFQQALNRRKAHGQLFIDDVHLAAETWFLYNYSFNARGRTYSERAETWRHNKITELEKIISNLSSRNIEVYRNDALWLIENSRFINSSSCFWYVDPPYEANVRSKGNLYRIDMKETARHCELLRAIGGATAKIALSGYSTSLYDDYLLKRDWHKYSLGEYNKSCDVSIGKSKGTEIIWTNYDIAKEAPKALEHITECK